jgi:hypothetical protein
MADVDTILRRNARMESDRANFEQLWGEVADVLLPRQADFIGSSGSYTQGARRTERIYDETAMLALDHGVSAFEGEVIPQGGQWQKLTTRHPELLKSQAVRLWLEQKTDLLFSLRNSPFSGFGNQSHESIASLLAFGMQGMWPDVRRSPAGKSIGLTYQSRHIGQLYIRENVAGLVDTVHRKFRLSHRQAYQQWGEQAPEAVQKGLRDNRPDDEAEYLHVIEPNSDYDGERIDAKGKRIASCYVGLQDKVIFAEGGYRTMPLIVSRFEKSPTETYGRGPGINILPAVKAAQVMMRDLIAATELELRPPLLAHDDMQDVMIFFEPDGVSYGGLDDRGQPTVRKMLESPTMEPVLVLQERTRQIIERAFYVDLYQVRQEQKTHISATEIMQRQAEKGVLLAPLLRQQDEWFTPMAERELDLMAEMGLLDDMPPELVEAGGIVEVVYENPLARARKADEAAGFFQMIQGISPLGQVDQSWLQALTRRYNPDKVIGGLAYIGNVPTSWENDDDEKKQIDEQRDAQIKMDTLLNAGDRAGNIAKNFAQAGAAEAGPGGAGVA